MPKKKVVKGDGHPVLGFPEDLRRASRALDQLVSHAALGDTQAEQSMKILNGWEESLGILLSKLQSTRRAIAEL